jgi:hypothetical protein
LVLHVTCAGFDFLNSQEVNAGRFMAAGGYKTAHFGKVSQHGATLSYHHLIDEYYYNRYY